MEFEDSREALFSEPNAYIQRFERHDRKETKKIVFQEPYESMPAFYINNNFTKHGCNCVPKSHFCDCDHDHENKFNRNQYDHNNRHDCNFDANYKQCQHGDNCHHDCLPKHNNLGFDLKNLLPLLGMFNKNGGADFSQIAQLINNNNNGNDSNPMSLISGILSNKDAMSGILNLFKGGRVFNKKSTNSKELKTTDFEIKNYTRVE